jgi:hypothetical protein
MTFPLKGVGSAATLARKTVAASGPSREQQLATIDARIGELSKTWANARTPAQKQELSSLKAERAKLSPPVEGPLLNPVQPKSGPVPRSVLDRAQAQLDAGDRGGAYLTLYKELGNEQLLVQAQITTYTGVWGSGALTGNAMAKTAAGERYQGTLDKFSHDIDQATIDAIRADLDKGGTGRLNDNQFQDVDRDVWKKRGMPELFPGNSQLGDFIFGSHDFIDGAKAFFSKGTWSAMKVGMLKLMPDTSLFGINQNPQNMSRQVGKRPSEYANDSNFQVHGGPKDRFVTVVDKRTGHVECFWDRSPRMGPLPLPQLPDEPLAKDSAGFKQRQTFYEFLGANRHATRR